MVQDGNTNVFGPSTWNLSFARVPDCCALLQRKLDFPNYLVRSARGELFFARRGGATPIDTAVTVALLRTLQQLLQAGAAPHQLGRRRKGRQQVQKWRRGGRRGMPLPSVRPAAAARRGRGRRPRRPGSRSLQRRARRGSGVCLSAAQQRTACNPGPATWPAHRKCCRRDLSVRGSAGPVVKAAAASRFRCAAAAGSDGFPLSPWVCLSDGFPCPVRRAAAAVPPAGAEPLFPRACLSGGSCCMRPAAGNHV
jgi:hypothetical protein